MSGRRTNLALLGLTITAVISGFAAFSVGTSTGAWIVVAHGILGLGILILTPWKGPIARRGFTRHGPTRWVSLSLAASTVVTLTSGLVLVTGLLTRIGPLTAMQIHVGSGLTTLALTLVHISYRPVIPRATDLSRRNAIRATSLLGAAGFAALAGERILELSGAPGATRRFTGSHEIAAPTPLPATQWLNDTVPILDGLSHRVATPSGHHSVDRIESHGDTVTATLDCTGGWHSTRTWSGARLDRLLGDPPGESVIVRSVTGYWRRFPLNQAGSLLLATRIDGEPLRAGNGAPVRLVAPGRRGFWWVKWVNAIEVDGKPPWWQPPLPTA